MRVSAKLEEDDVRIVFPYSPEMVSYVKQIPGRRYDPQTRSWIIPKPQWKNFSKGKQDLEVAVSPQDEEMLRQLEQFTYSPISKIQGFKGQLYPFQAAAVGFLVARQRALLADEMGLGKSVMSIAAALELRNRGLVKRILVFCPKTIIPQWVNEYERFTGEKAIAISGNTDQRNKALCQAHNVFFVVTNYETILRDYEDLAGLKPGVVIIDEAQRIGTYNAKTTQLIKSLFQKQYRWALTGTPLENALSEVHSIMDWVDEGILGPWFAFKNTYLVYGGFRGKQIVGYRNLQRLHEQLRDWMLRRRKAEVLQDLPPVTVNTYHVELSSEEWKLYKQIRDDLERYYRNYNRTQGQMDSGEILAKLMYLRECCDHTALVSCGKLDSRGEKSAKLDELVKILQDLGEQKIVVFTEFERMLHLIADSLNMGYATLYGSMDQRQRVNAIHNFTNDRNCRVFVSTEAGGLGVNLQVASCIINFDVHWNPARLQQRIGRLHRIGQKNTVTCINLIARSTIEERVLRVISEKTMLFRRVVDGDFGNPSFERTIWRILAEEFPEAEGRIENWQYS